MSVRCTERVANGSPNSWCGPYPNACANFIKREDFTSSLLDTLVPHASIKTPYGLGFGRSISVHRALKTKRFADFCTIKFQLVSACIYYLLPLTENRGCGSSGLYFFSFCLYLIPHIFSRSGCTSVPKGRNSSYRTWWWSSYCRPFLQ